MTQQLADARTLAQRSLADLAGATTKLQAILDTLTTGVIVHGIDDEQRKKAYDCVS